jgi:hypothetical protein
VESVLAAYRAEGSRLVETARAVDLVERALRGEAFTPQLGGDTDDGRSVTRRRASGGKSKRAKSARPSKAEPAADMRATG